MNKEILLTTLNARYSHTSLALRYLYANLKDMKEKAFIKEFVIGENNQILAEKILETNPKIIGFSVYIWNIDDTKEIIDILKAIAPNILIVLGGPEVSYEPLRVDIKYDYIIRGEGEVEFYNICKNYYENTLPSSNIIQASQVDINTLILPYDDYSDHDIQNRLIYVESSRGCAFKCEFCLSSLDNAVRVFELDTILKEYQKLWDRGVRNFKFIDRTFNLNIKYASALIDFFLAKDEPYSVHFEVIPDNFPESLRQKVSLFPPASLQFEIGIQTLQKEVAKNIKRNLNIPKIEENLKFLEQNTKAHIHLDLIVGLPGESLSQFGENLNKLYTLSKSEIQVGILKKLSGTTLDRHDKTYGMVYSNNPPYDLLANNEFDYKTMQKMKRFARYWDIVYNSGNFKLTCQKMFEDGNVFETFFALSEYIYDTTASTWQISYERMSEFLFNFLTKKFDKKHIAELLIDDCLKVTRRKLPSFLREFVDEKIINPKSSDITKHNKRQLKHL